MVFNDIFVTTYARECGVVMKKLLISWIGQNDLDSVHGQHAGPIRAALNAATVSNQLFEHIHLLYNYPYEQVSSYIDLLNEELESSFSNGYTQVTSAPIALSSPSNYSEIYPAVDQQLAQLEKQFSGHQWTIHLSPGTPAMSSVWILLVKTKYPAECIESWLDKSTGEDHVKTVNLPFNLSAEFTQSALHKADTKLTSVAPGKGTLVDRGNDPFDRIIGSCDSMVIAKQRAEKMAKRNVPVLLLGASGTGKELFAQAIHQASPRKDHKFVPVNCAALPLELAESLLFGHKKGAFTGAAKDHSGFFEQANGGTLFLDELGELPLTLQAKLLRALQEKEFIPVGGLEPISVDVRIISATHRDLGQMINEERFREDLFYRLAIGVIKIPSLSERLEDLPLLFEHLIRSVDDDLADQPDYVRKAQGTLDTKTGISNKIYQEVIKFISERHWRGNVRELQATLQRAMIWSEDARLTVSDLKQATLDLPVHNASSHSANDSRELLKPIDIKEKQSEVAKQYIELALKKTGGNKTKAAKLVGLNSQQTLTSWMEKLAINPQDD